MGEAFSHQQVLLVVKCWAVVTPPQSPTSRQGSDTTPGASSTSPEAPSAARGTSSISPEASETPTLEALPLSRETETSSPGVGAFKASASSPAATSPRAAAAGSEAAGISRGLEVSTAPRQRRSGSGDRQKHAASSLPAVAVKLFGPQYDDARNQDALVRMVTGCGLPFRCASYVDMAYTCPRHSSRHSQYNLTCTQHEQVVAVIMLAMKLILKLVLACHTSSICCLCSVEGFVAKYVKV